MNNKVKIRVITLGAIPHDLELSKISKWQSNSFDVIDQIEAYAITSDSDGNWQFSDENILQHLPPNAGEDFLVALTNVPLQYDWYTRRVRGNAVVFTLHEISNYLRFNNIPIINVVYRLLYAYSLVYRENKLRIPESNEYTNFTHDETRGCIYDMNGLKYDIIHSCDGPIICSACAHRLENSGVSISLVKGTQSEIKKIRKELFYRVSSWISRHPILSIIIASLWAFVIGLTSSYVSNEVWPPNI